MLALFTTLVLAGNLASMPAAVPVSTPAAVHEAQARLKELGYDAGRIDGWYGPRTAKALKAFQKNEELRATGAIDPATLERLMALPRYFRGETKIPEIHDSAKVDDDEREKIIDLYSTAQVEDERTRLIAVDLLAKQGTERAFAALKLVLLTNDSVTVRASAAEKIAAFGDLRSLDALVYAQGVEKDPAVKAAIDSLVSDALPTEPSRTLVPADDDGIAVADDPPDPLPLDD